MATKRVKRGGSRKIPTPLKKKKRTKKQDTFVQLSYEIAAMRDLVSQLTFKCGEVAGIQLRKIEELRQQSLHDSDETKKFVARLFMINLPKSFRYDKNTQAIIEDAVHKATEPEDDEQSSVTFGYDANGSPSQ